MRIIDSVAYHCLDLCAYKRKRHLEQGPDAFDWEHSLSLYTLLKWRLLMHAELPVIYFQVLKTRQECLNLYGKSVMIKNQSL